MIGHWLTVLFNNDLFSAHIRYEDGRTEYILVPVAYEVGTKLIVTKKRMVRLLSRWLSNGYT